MTANAPVNLWASTGHARDYLERADSIPHRTEGESALLEFIPHTARRILDLGTGNGRLLALVKTSLAPAEAESVAVDFSPAMLEAAGERFEGDSSVTIVAHNLDLPLPALGKFDAAVSSFAIHHLVHERKRALYAEIYGLLSPGGVFCNLSMWPRPRSACMRNFCTASATPSKLKTRRTSCWTSKHSCNGCARSASWMWIVTGSGGSWRCW